MTDTATETSATQPPADMLATLTRLRDFAAKHNLTLEPRGEVGFGRPCVGFVGAGSNYVDYDPRMSGGDYEPIWPIDARLHPPEGTPDAYHKHDCLAVLVHGDDYDAALVQLAKWVDHLEAQGEVYVETYRTGAVGIQAMFSGTTGRAVRMR